MNRLSTKLILAMLGIAIFSAIVIIVSQFVGARVYLYSLPADVRLEVIRRTDSRPPWANPFRNKPPQRILEQQERLSATELGHATQRDDFVRGLADVQDYQRRASFIGVGVAALLAGIIALVIARTISRPVERVAKAAELVTRGNLSVRVKGQTSTLEVRALTDNFNEMAAALEDGEQQRRAMIADIAHELRTPLAAMKLRFQALEDELLPFDKEQVQRLHLQTDLLTRLVQDLRTLSLADEGRLSLKKRDTDLVCLLEAITESYQVKAHEAHVRLAFTSHGEHVSAQVDDERVTQMLGNLIDNALRVTSAGGQVSVVLENARDTAIISVTDTGPGIPAQIIGHLFERFYQERDTKGSSGLGLAIVKALAELHGGGVSASNTGHGAQFQVSLPRLSAQS